MGKTYGNENAESFVRGGEVKGREAVRRSTQTTWRRANPPNMTLAECVPNFVFDYAKQKALQPHIVKGLKGSEEHPLRCANLDGKSATYVGKIVVGSGSDDKGKF